MIEDDKTNNMYAAMTKDNNHPLFLYTLITIFAGLITGTNIAVISGAIPLLQEYWGTGDIILGALVAIFMAGACLGGLIGKRHSRGMNRKYLMVLSVILLIFSPLGNALAGGVYTMLVFRFTAGVGAGILETVIPACLSALFSSRVRIALLSYHHLSIAIGILIAYIANYLLLGHVYNWRLIMGFPVVFSLVCFLLIIVTRMPHSVSASSHECDGQPNGIQRHRSILFLTSLQPLSGISVIICYTPGLFGMTGLGSDTALTYTVFAGIINLLFTLVAIWQTEVLSNRKLLIWGSLGLSLSLLYLVYIFTIPVAGNAELLFALLCYLGCFMLSAMPFIPGNRYPPASSKPKKAAGISPMVVGYLLSFVTLLFFPWQLSNWGGAVTFGIFTVFSVLNCLFILFRLPDTTTNTIHYSENKLTVKQSS